MSHIVQRQHWDIRSAHKWLDCLYLPDKAIAGFCAQEEMLVRESGSQPDAFSILVSLAVINNTMSAEQGVQQASQGSDPSDLPRSQNSVLQWRASDMRWPWAEVGKEKPLVRYSI